ncbi:hypothetical protein H5410_057993 [Solanum commersonii]|uniref:Uncharacterized protein n=1 Tax=Solanum commersonii TaxID=4109 RepID=A0A9J5WPF9_SOLCO|nr:hypothetical protein H5410_057993 [Solanum commersonii]
MHHWKMMNIYFVNAQGVKRYGCRGRKEVVVNSYEAVIYYTWLTRNQPIEDTHLVNESKSEECVVKKWKMISPDDSIVEIKKKTVNFDPKKAFDAILKELGWIAITEIVRRC